MAEITGRKVFLFTSSAFGVIIAVNFWMAYQAVHTFPGLEVQSSYDESQAFNAERAAQIALGLTLRQVYDPALQQLSLRFTDAKGAPVQMKDISVLVGRSTDASDDFTPVLAYQDGAYQSHSKLGQGKWVLHVLAHAQNGTLFRQRLSLWVKG